MDKISILPRMTHQQIAAIEPRLTRMWCPDTNVENLYLLVQPGGSRSWVYDAARTGGGKKSRIKLTLGRFPQHGLAEAREWSRLRNEERDLGLDPAEVAKEAAKAAARANKLTMQKVFDEWCSHKLAVREAVASLDGYKMLFRKNIAPDYADTPIADFTKSDLRDAMKAAVARGSLGSAERVRVMMGTFLKWALYEDYVTSNVATTVAPIKTKGEGARDLSVAELALLWRATETMEDDDRDALRLLTLTGLRKMEVMAARADQYSDGVWLRPAAENKSGRDHPMQLSDKAREIFDRRSGKGGNLFGADIYPSMNPKLAEKAATAMEALSGGTVQPWSLHSIRKGVRTALGSDEMDEMGEVFSENIAEIVLNHSLGSLNRTYNKSRYQRQIGRALAAWERLLMQEVDKQTGANVVRLKA